MDLTALCGNAPLKRQLDLQTQGRGLSHAYIISGSPGSGKRLLARLLSAAMVCTGQGEAPCGQCPGCKKALAGIHPDVRTVGDDGKDITVAQAREIRADAYIRPNEAPRKVYILQNAQTMNQSAQNALLKLLEEGPPYAAFLLLTDNAAALLQTVRSRCELLSLSPVTQEQAAAWLSHRYRDKSPEVIYQAAQSCEGLLGRAVERLEGSASDREQAHRSAVQLLGYFSSGDELGLAQFCVALEKWDREAFSSLLEETVLLLRHALALRSGARSTESDPQRRAAAKQAAASRKSAALLSAVDLCRQLRDACTFNAGVGHMAGWLCAGLAGIR